MEIHTPRHPAAGFFVLGPPMRDILDLIFNWSDNRDVPVVIWRDDEGDYLACITLFDSTGQYRWTEVIDNRFSYKKAGDENEHANRVWKLLDVACTKAHAERIGVSTENARSKSKVEQIIKDAAKAVGRGVSRASDGRLVVSSN